MKTEKRTVGNMGVFEFKYNYNRLGQLAEKLYPGGVKESYQYDQYGYKAHTFANGMVIYKMDDYDGSVKKTCMPCMNVRYQSNVILRKYLNNYEEEK